MRVNTNDQKQPQRGENMHSIRKEEWRKRQDRRQTYERVKKWFIIIIVVVVAAVVLYFVAT